LNSLLLHQITFGYNLDIFVLQTQTDEYCCLQVAQAQRSQSPSEEQSGQSWQQVHDQMEIR